MRPVYPHRKAQLGLTLIELMLVLGIVTALSTFIFISFNQLKHRENARSEAQLYQILAKNAQLAYATSGTYPAAFNMALIYPVTPERLLVSPGGPLLNYWGGGIALTPATGPVVAGQPTAQAMRIDSDTIPNAVCASLASSASRYFESVLINGTNVKTSWGGDFDAVNAATLCAGGNSTVSMISQKYFRPAPIDLFCPTVNSTRPDPFSPAAITTLGFTFGATAGGLQQIVGPDGSRYVTNNPAYNMLWLQDGQRVC